MPPLQASNSTSSAADCSVNESTRTGCQPPSKKRKGLGAILSNIFDTDAQNETPLHPKEKVEVEISKYLNSPVVEMDSDPCNGGNMRKNVYLC